MMGNLSTEAPAGEAPAAPTEAPAEEAPAAEPTPAPTPTPVVLGTGKMLSDFELLKRVKWDNSLMTGN